MVLSPILYGHPFPLSYVFLEEYFYPTMWYHFWGSCIGIFAYRMYAMGPVFLGASTFKVPSGIGFVWFFVV